MGSSAVASDGHRSVGMAPNQRPRPWASPIFTLSCPNGEKDIGACKNGSTFSQNGTGTPHIGVDVPLGIRSIAMTYGRKKSATASGTPGKIEL